MIIPLYAKNIESYEGTKMEIWANKKQTIAEIPFLPYLYSKERRSIPIADESQEEVTFISDLKKYAVYKYSFGSVKHIPDYRDADSMECDIPYVQRAAIDDPRYFKRFPQTDELDIMFFDIEADTEGRFPKSEENPIIAISYAFNDEEPVVLKINELEEGDCNILTQFMDAMGQRDPDVIVTFFGNTFDIPYVIDRLNIHGISTSAFTRADGEAFFISDENEKIIHIKGRCLFDIYDEVQKDQSLFGIADRKMKTVAEWFNLQRVIRKRKGFENYDVIVEDISNTRHLIGTKRLHDYALSDVLITRELSKIYLPNVVTFAEMIGVPLNIMMRRSPSMVGTIYYARNLKHQGVISDQANFQRFPTIYGKPEEVFKYGRMKTEFVGGTKFQGAIVDINPEKQGKVIKDIYHVDFSSLYPSIIRYFNLSPETLTFIQYKDFIDGFFKFTDLGDKFQIEFGDDRIKKNVVVEVIRKEGFLPRSLKEFMDKRDVIKENLKHPDLDDDKRVSLTSQSWVYKVMGNSSYGLVTSGFFRYGNVYVGVTTTAIGRYLIRWVKKKLQEWIELDTDGAYNHGFVDAVAFSKEINIFLKERFNIDAKFELEANRYPAGFFMKMKNYVLLTSRNTLVKHGVSFKASSKNHIFADALEKIAMALLTGKDIYEVARECYDISKRGMSDFVQRTRINRPLNEYAIQPSAGKKGCLQVQVGQQVEDYHDSAILVGDSISYIKTMTGYEIRETASDQKIDKDYYRKQVISVLKRFNEDYVIWQLKNPGQKTMGDFA